MAEEIFKRPYRVRKAAKWGKEITIAPEAKMQPGDEVVQWYDGFILIVPQGAKVNEEILVYKESAYEQFNESARVFGHKRSGSRRYAPGWRVTGPGREGR